MVDVSEHIKNRSDSSELLQNVDKFGENVTGSYLRVTHLYKYHMPCNNKNKLVFIV